MLRSASCICFKALSLLHLKILPFFDRVLESCHTLTHANGEEKELPQTFTFERLDEGLYDFDMKFRIIVVKDKHNFWKTNEIVAENLTS